MKVLCHKVTKDSMIHLMMFIQVLPSSVPVGQFQLSPILTEICIISDNYHPPTHPQDSSEQTTLQAQIWYGGFI